MWHSLAPLEVTSVSFNGNKRFLRYALLVFLVFCFNNIMLPQLTRIITWKVKCIIATFRNLKKIVISLLNIDGHVTLNWNSTFNFFLFKFELCASKLPNSFWVWKVSVLYFLYKTNTAHSVSTREKTENVSKQKHFLLRAFWSKKVQPL